MKAINLEALIYSVLDALLYLSIGLIFLYVSQFYQKGDELTAGFFVAYIFYLQKLFDPLKEMSGRFAVLQSAFSALGKINSIMDLPLPKDEGAAELKQHDIHIEDLSFSYKEGQSVIKNISLEIPRGTSAAFVGPTGSGKTTMVKLLTRQYDVGEGRILLGGHSLSEYPRELLKKEIVMVPQDPAIFHESVLFNITLNRAEVKKEDVYDICRKIKLDRFIKGLPNGYDTILSEGGKNLSCGQRQLLAMARALASPAEILIFDEATANIDSETESLIQEALDYVMSQKTTIVIAHRLSTIRHTKQIVVLKDGEILEKGSHDELMKEQGLYARMYDIQSMEK